MAKRIIRGKFFYEDEETKKKKSKKQLRKEQLKAMKIKDKEIAKQCECNHLDRKHNKTHFKTSECGVYRICKICGGRMFKDPDMVSREVLESATTSIYTVLSLVRNRMNVSEEMDESITNALRVISRVPDLADMLKDEHFEAKKGGKKKKGKKNKKKNKNKFSRVVY